MHIPKRERERERERDRCRFISVKGDQRSESERDLSKYPVLIRYDEALSIIEKVLQRSPNSLESLISPISPFGLPTTARGQECRDNSHSIKLYYSYGGIGWISEKDIPKTVLLNKWKVIISKATSEHGLKPGQDGKYRIFSRSMKVLGPKEACTFSYFVAGNFNVQSQAENLERYLETKFTRFLILQRSSSIDLSRSSFQFVPMQDFSPSSDIPWERPLKDVEEALCKKYCLDSKDREFIDSLIREW